MAREPVEQKNRASQTVSLDVMDLEISSEEETTEGKFQGRGYRFGQEAQLHRFLNGSEDQTE